uniref:Uncharacterized protein n=1 Tax=Arion vulgaris TaxID=1028688 RepID=A0A0B7ACP0_9EUPU
MTASSIGQSTHKIMNSSSMKRKDTLPCDNAINTQSHNNTSFEIMENDYMRENNISDSDAVIYEQTREENTYERLDNNGSNSENDVQTRCDGAEIDVSTSNKVNLKIEDELINENPIHFYEELNSEEPRISCAYLDIDNVPIIRNSTATYVEMSRSCSNIYENAELYSNNDINGMITHVSEEEIGSRSEVDYVNFKSAGI